MSVLGIPIGSPLLLSPQSQLRFYDDSQVGYVGLKAPSSASSSLIYALPSSPPSVDGQVLAATTGGVLSWITPAVGGGGGSGETNTASNVGTGAQVFKLKSGVDLQFRSILPGSDEASQRTIAVATGTNEVTVRAYGTVPVGCVVAWLKSLPGVPGTLPDGFVECDGRTISDGASPLNGVTIPNLNNTPPDGSHQVGANRFLRGNTSSGSAGGTDTHVHQLIDTVSLCAGTGQQVTAARPTLTNSASTLPTYYTVVWIMRIK